MKNELQTLYETALAIQKEKECTPYRPLPNHNEQEAILKELSSCTTNLIISAMKSNSDAVSMDIGKLMIQIFTLMANEGISLEEINLAIKK